jgi:hypothetical protein
MRFFSVLDFQYTILLLFLGLILFILIYIAFGGYALPTRKGRGEEIEEYPEGIRAKNGPLPLLLFFIYLSFIIWAIGYVVVIGIRGGAF